ncbi:hypothetical protein, partial [Aedoeadaptatus coxii]|uniref:hypothetical protein n=1 Tax=Aedoeadaptatus coxii TaxID=755172 RepID=UPI002AD4E981
NKKKMPAAFSPSYAIQAERNTLQLFKRTGIYFASESRRPTHKITSRNEAQYNRSPLGLRTSKKR